MRYSLLSRFQGALLGAALGDQWGLHVQLQRGQPLSTHPLRGEQESDPFVQVPFWGKLARAIAHLLITQSQPDWRLLDLSGNLGEVPPNPTELAMGLAIATVPLALFTHDQQDQKQLPFSTARTPSLLEAALTTWQIPPTTGGCSDLSRVVFSQILCEKLQPSLFLEDLLEDAHLRQTQTHLLEALVPVHQALLQGMSLKTTLRTLKAQATEATNPFTLPPSLALYCFLSTPDHFELTLRRAAQSSTHPRLICALAGAWSGCYNGGLGGSARWLYPPSSNSSADSLSRLWGIESTQVLLDLSHRLLQSWAGVYSSTGALGPALAIAAPEVLR